MKLQIKFINFDKSPALETFVKSHLGALKRRLKTKKVDLAKIKVSLRLDAKAPMGQLKNSQATIQARVPGIPKSFVASQKDANLRVAVKEASVAITKMVRRETEKKERSRKTMGKTMRRVRRGRAL